MSDIVGQWYMENVPSHIHLIEKRVQEYLQQNDNVTITKDVIVLFFIYKYVLGPVFSRGHGNAYYQLKTRLVKLYKRFWYFLIFTVFQKKTSQEMNTLRENLVSELVKQNSEVNLYSQLPEEGMSDSEVMAYMERQVDVVDGNFADILNGKVSGAVYHGGAELVALQSKVYELYCITNQLHPDCFPSLRNMESEVVSIVLGMFGGQGRPDAKSISYNAGKTLHTGEYSFCGTTTSGGTESILVACLSARNYHMEKHGCNADECEIIIPETAHAAFYKAAEYFNMQLTVVGVNNKKGKFFSDYKVNLQEVARKVSKKTCLLVGSAPNFPHGIIDDIEELSKLALKWDIPLHVDCCLGSLLMPFYKEQQREQGDSLQNFDFSVPGVTSISCDTHKYGFCPKGSSVVMYKYSALRAKQYYIQTDWTGGLYGSPTLQGSRAGALVANCFSTLIKFGKTGYRDSFHRINGALEKIKSAINQDPLLSAYLEIVGDPQVCVVAFKFKRNPQVAIPADRIYTLGDVLKTEHGYHLSCLQKPQALHYALTHLAAADENITLFLEALKQSLKVIITEAKEVGPSGKGSNETGQMYGVAGSIKTSAVASKIVETFLDVLYEPA